MEGLLRSPIRSAGSRTCTSEKCMKGDKCEFSHENANMNVQPGMSIMSSEDVNRLQYTWVSRSDVEEIDD